MKKSILLIIILISTLQCFTQEEYNSENFRVTLGDITSKTFKKDSTANAIVIYEHGNSYIDRNDYDLRTEKKHKIKILKRAGFKNANVTILIYNNERGREKVLDIIGTTYNHIEGKVVKTKLKEEDIFREKYDENHTLVKFTLPNIKEGSVISYSYKLISPFKFKYHGWNFQDDIPKLYSQYNTSIPGNWIYHIKLVGGKKLTINDSKLEKRCLEVSNGAYSDCSVSTYAMKDIPAFIEEDYTTTKKNYLARIEYELETFQGMDGIFKHYTKTWKDVDKELRKDKEIGKQIKKTIDLEEFLDINIINETDELKKAKSIYKYVQNNYVWNEEFQIFKDVSIKDLIKNKSGNVSSINILLNNLLRESNIEVNPVLLSTRNNGFPTTIYPVLYDYNYLIVQAKINNKTYLLDATDKYLSFGQIPFRCLNKQGRLIDFNTGSKWVDLKSSSASSTLYNAEFSFDEDNVLRGKINSRRTGYHALTSKKSYFRNSESYINSLENGLTDSEILDFKVKSNDITNPHFQESYHVVHHFDEAGKKIYLNPFLIKFFSENPFKLQERTYPIDFGYKDSYYYSFKLQINDKYIIEETPKNLILKLPNNSGQILFSSNILGDSLILTLKIEFKKSIYEPEYYDYLKTFMSKLVDIQTNSIVLLSKSK
jgi:hypothetical protein